MKIINRLVLSFLVIILIGCNNSSDENSDTVKNATKAAEKMSVTSQNESGEISANLNINKKPINKMVPVELRLNLKFGKNNAQKALISMDLTMPEMSMPKNEIKLIESLPGIYSGQAIFTMSGSWRLMTYVHYNGKKYDMYFDIKVE